MTITKTSPLFPPLLKNSLDCPEVLYVEGNVDLFQKPAISIVGSRNMTSYGKYVLEQFVPQLVSAGLVVVSGLAYGVDSYAHRLTLQAGGCCVAVLAGPLTNVYPAANHGLFRRILQNGGVALCEYPAHTPVQKFFFPLRNRIVAALSQVTLIIEAGETSGTLITARYALDYGREVCVIPADISREQSRGVHRLLKEGAVKAVTCCEDILSLYQMEVPVFAKEPLRPALTGSPFTLYDCISKGIQTTEGLIQATGWSITQLQSVLSVLELDRYIEHKGHTWQTI